MSDEQLAVLLGFLPEEQRYTAGRLIQQAEKFGWSDLRLFDRIELINPCFADLIGTHPGSGDTDFLIDFLLE